MKAPLLEIDGLSVDLPTSQGMRLIIDGVTLTVGVGEAVGLVGESGSGKSTTARSVLRALPKGAQHRGEIRFEGRDILQMRSGELRELRASHVQMIFQDPKAYINPVHKVGDFLTEALRCHNGMSRKDADDRVVGLLEEVGVSRARERLRQYPHELSGGLLQRIMIASVLAVDPQLLIADEPTTALDVTTQADVVGLINRLRHDRDMAVLFITHDLELASAFCDRTAVMYAGRIVEDQSAAHLHKQPLHPYTAALFASRPDVSRAAARLPTIPGHPMSAAESPAGCSFAPRCPYSKDECVAATPPLRHFETGRVACVRAEELTDTLRSQSTAVGA